MAISTLTPTLEDIAREAGSRSSEIEQLRHLPSDLVDRLTDTQIFKLWVPRAYGGSEAHVLDAVEAIESIAFHDGSTAWCTMIAITTGLSAGRLPADYAREIYARRDAITGGFAYPSGTAVAVDGGIRATGRWSWGSGTGHCTSIGGGVKLLDTRGEPTTMPDGSPWPFVYFDLEDVELLDTWHVAGLKGTGSGDYTVDSAFVPHGRWVNFTSPESVVDSPLYRFSFFGALAVGAAAVMVGLARRAIAELIALADKVPTNSSRNLAVRAPVQAELADADASVRGARAFLRETIESCWAAAESGTPATDEHKRLLRLATTNAAGRCAHTVDLCYHAGGGSSVFSSSPLQRIFRDTHVATQHGMLAQRNLEPLGRLLFGLSTDTSAL